MSRLESSPEGRIRNILKTYQIGTVLDVGANRGQFGKILRREARYAGEIISFEPLPDAFETLQKVVRHDDNWQALNFGLGSHNEVLEINIAQNSASSSFLPSSDRLSRAAPQTRFVGTTRVQVRALDEIFTKLQLSSSNIYLKIDAQGFESRILYGADKSLSLIDTVQMEMALTPMYEGALPFEELFAVMSQRRYKLVHLIPGLFDRATGELLEVDGVFHREDTGTRNRDAPDQGM